MVVLTDLNFFYPISTFSARSHLSKLHPIKFDFWSLIFLTFLGQHKEQPFCTILTSKICDLAKPLRAEILICVRLRVFASVLRVFAPVLRVCFVTKTYQKVWNNVKKYRSMISVNDTAIYSLSKLSQSCKATSWIIHFDLDHFGSFGSFGSFWRIKGQLAKKWVNDQNNLLF